MHKLHYVTDNKPGITRKKSGKNFIYFDVNGKKITDSTILARIHDITSGHVNEYLHRISGENFTAKDFCTWSATVLAAWALNECEKFDSTAQAKKNILRAIEKVAKKLGNTPTICRKSYIHPEVINAYMDGQLKKMLQTEIKKTLQNEYETLGNEEILVLTLLRKRLGKVQHAQDS